MKAGRLAGALSKLLADKPPAVFLVAGTAGFVATVAMAVKAAEPARKAIESAPLPEKSVITDGEGSRPVLRASRDSWCLDASQLLRRGSFSK